MNLTAAKAQAAAVVAAIIQAVGQLLALGIVTGSARNILEVVVGVLTVIGGVIATYVTPNQPKPPVMLTAPPPAK